MRLLALTAVVLATLGACSDDDQVRARAAPVTPRDGGGGVLEASEMGGVHSGGALSSSGGGNAGVGGGAGSGGAPGRGGTQSTGGRVGTGGSPSPGDASPGDGGSGGTSSGGASSGGANSGGTSSGGSSGGGGTPGGSSGRGGTGGSVTCDTTVQDLCARCSFMFCCTEVTDCVGRCAGTGGEFACMRNCLTSGFSGTGGSTELSVCADLCRGPSAVVAASTQSLFECLTQTSPLAGGGQLCSTFCFGGEPQ